MADYEFRQHVERVTAKIRLMVQNEKNPQLPENVNHVYEDKYLLAEFMVNSGLRAVENLLSFLGLSSKDFDALSGHAKKGAVSLRFRAEESCTFIKEATRKVEDPTSSETSIKAGIGPSINIKSKVVHKITEYFWKYEVAYELSAHVGADPDHHKVVLQSRTSSSELVTTSKDSPHPARLVRPPLTMNLAFLFKQASGFSIDRGLQSTRTPRRNEAVDTALDFFNQLSSVLHSIEFYFKSQLFPVITSSSRDVPVNSLSAVSGILVPVVPLLPILSSDDLRAMMQEQKRSMAEKLADVTKEFSSQTGVISSAEAQLCVILAHGQAICTAVASSLQHLEDLLHSQLVAAIGRELSVHDFNAYMRFHARKVFRDDAAPRAFCYAVRRPEHYPEGTLSVESGGEPVDTLVRRAERGAPMEFALNAATKVRFGGARCLHGLVVNKFAGETGVALELVARARQFSSFILLVGRIAGPRLFQPAAGVILQNKDELRIPLLLEDIPSAKEFKDAISSLSPDMQRFAKAFRAMQLESTLFGVCVVQIKPQLERLLRLPYDSLTKEIRLTQDLLELFITYQIPSDLLSCAQDDASPAEALEEVSGYVRAMQGMIEDSKSKQLNDRAQEALYAIADEIAEEAAPQIDFDDAPPSRSEDRRMVRKKSKESAKRDAEPVKMMRREAQRPAKSQSLSSTSTARPSNAPAPRPQPQQQQQQTQLPPQTEKALEKAPEVEQSKGEVVELGKGEVVEHEKGKGEAEDEAEDYTQLPTILEAQYEALGPSIRPSIIHTSPMWTRTGNASLMSPSVTSIWGADEQKKEKDRCFDLLDALTKSGALLVEEAELHVIIAASHSFEKSVMRTVYVDNFNPIELVEKTQLLVAATILGEEEPQSLLK